MEGIVIKTENPTSPESFCDRNFFDELETSYTEDSQEHRLHNLGQRSPEAAVTAERGASSQLESQKSNFLEQCTSSVPESQGGESQGTSKNNQRLCLVCGDVASGYHYGVASCEACKAFFKRTVQGNIQYVCPAVNECDITKRRRKSCQSCRYGKCLVMGMMKEGVRLDRVRGGRQKYHIKRKQECLPPAETLIAKKSKGFTTMSLNDQMTLLQSAWNEVLILGLAYRSIPHQDTLAFADDFAMSRNDSKEAKVDLLNDLTLRLTDRFRKLKLDKEEYVILKGLVLCNSDITHLEDPPAIERVQDTLYDALHDHLQRHHALDKRRVIRLLLTLPLLRQISSASIHHLHQLLGRKELPLNQLIQEMITAKIDQEVTFLDSTKQYNNLKMESLDRSAKD
uniref:Estrogen-related receptor gamma-like n=1 Tax=Saccoglossus kowalevskii TaxID=10224 RepID=A0ABM0MXV9_SACKO|nr:PREDICTED: estrogen-related receptor gamma-like [Saccoglossus kowalevskii]